jgi:hypothetical protein
MHDVQAWPGLTRLREMARRLRTFRDSAGAELFDRPDARPSPDTDALVRLIAEFDNLILSHADRTQINRTGTAEPAIYLLARRSVRAGGRRGRSAGRTHRS